MSREFVVEAADAIVRMKKDMRRRQLYGAVGAGFLTLFLLPFISGLALVIMAAAVIWLLMLEAHGTKLEGMLETVGAVDAREYFASSRDGLFVATPQWVFAEKARGLFPYQDARRTVASVDYDEAGHQLVLRVSVRSPVSKADAAPSEKTLQLAFPRGMSTTDAERITKRIALWAASGIERTV